jgi:hypothetical protein
MTEGVRLIPGLLGRSGPVACIGFNNYSKGEAILTNVALMCSARSEKLFQAMLFGVPLGILGQEKNIKIGQTAFEIAIQGFSLADPMNPLARRNFENVLGMIRARVPVIANLSSDRKAAGEFSDAAKSFVKELIEIRSNDSLGVAKRVSDIDEQLVCRLSVSWLGCDGQVAGNHFLLDSRSVIWWLSNYIIGTEQSIF